MKINEFVPILGIFTDDHFLFELEYFDDPSLKNFIGGLFKGMGYISYQTAASMGSVFAIYKGIENLLH